MKKLICILPIILLASSLSAKVGPISIEWHRTNMPTGKTVVNRLECTYKCVWIDAHGTKSLDRSKLEKLLQQVVKIQVVDKLFSRLEVVVFHNHHERKSKFSLPTAYTQELKLFLQLEKLAAQSKELQ